MKKLKIYFAFLFSFIVFPSFAQNQPNFIVKNGPDGYEMHLEIEKENFDTVFINGFYSNKGKNQRFTYVLNKHDMFKKKNPETKIHNLDSSMDYAFYTISIKKSDGSLVYYPCVKVNMPFENAIVKI